MKRQEPRESENNNAASFTGIAIIIIFLFAFAFFSIAKSTDPLDPNTPITLGSLFIGTILLLVFIRWRIAASKPNPYQELARPEEEREAKEQEQAQAAKARLRKGNPDAMHNSTTSQLDAVLGATISGDSTWIIDDWVTVPAAELSKHGVLIGGSGSGKTISLLRLAYIATIVYGYRVFFLDAKGDQDTAARFLALMHELGRNPLMFPHQSYDGWRGDSTALLNRLMAIESFSEPYYKAVTKRVLTLICSHQDDPPRSTQAFFNRFNDELKSQSKLNAREIAGVELRYRAFFDALQGRLDHGWSWEDTNAGYILLDGLSLKEEAASLGRFLVEDFAHYATTRKQTGKDLLIIDEYSALAQSGADAANLVERLRSYDCAVILSSQSYAGLGEQQDAERILDAANWLLIHRNAAPERLTRRAGTIKEIQSAYQFGEQGPAPALDNQGHLRLEEEDAVHPDQARRLQTGEAILIAHGRHAKVRIATPPASKEDLIDQARAWMNQPTSTTQPTNQSQSTQPITPPIQKQQSTPKPPYTGPELL